MSQWEIACLSLLDYDQSGNPVQWHPDKQAKRKKKPEGPGVTAESTDEQAGNVHSDYLSLSTKMMLSIIGVTRPIRQIR